MVNVVDIGDSVRTTISESQSVVEKSDHDVYNNYNVIEKFIDSIERLFLKLGVGTKTGVDLAVVVVVL